MHHKENTMRGLDLEYAAFIFLHYVEWHPNIYIFIFVYVCM